jgi:choline dehydrogenase-like flavoprotein
LNGGKSVVILESGGALSPIDVERRDCVPGSGWPLTAADLDPYYREARAIFGLSPHQPQLATLHQHITALPAFDPDELATPLWSFDNQFDRFSFSRCQDVVGHPRCTVVTHATVTDIAVTHVAGEVCRVGARSLTGNTIAVRGGTYVLAAGGIENPRLLLASRSVAASGLGNAYDQVGRYFMEQLHARGGRIVGGKAWSLLAAFNLRRRIGSETIAPLIAPGAMLQKREGLLNTSLTIAPRPRVRGRRGLAMQLYMHAKHNMVPRPNRMEGREAGTGLGQACQPPSPALVATPPRQDGVEPADPGGAIPQSQQSRNAVRGTGCTGAAEAGPGLAPQRAGRR